MEGRRKKNIQNKHVYLAKIKKKKTINQIVNLHKNIDRMYSPTHNMY